MQTGTIARRGSSWVLRYYEPRLGGGQRQVAKKLVDVSAEYPDSHAP